MKYTTTICALFTLATSLAVAADAPKRSKLACGAYLEGVKSMSKSMGLNPTIVPGSWGDVPRDLQALPAGAQNCGTVEGQPTIVSPLFGKELETFYTPLFAKMGCAPFKCEVESQGSATRTMCKCKSSEVRGTVVTDTGYEAYSLGLFARWGKKK